MIFCVIINLFCYWLTVEVYRLQKDTKLHIGSKVKVTFDVSFYLVAAAGGVGVIATAMNCLRRYPTHDQQAESLLDEYDGMEGAFPGLPPPDIPVGQSSPMSNLPPPAYTP